MANEFKIKNGLLVSGSITGVTESGTDNSAKMASTSWVRTYIAANPPVLTSSQVTTALGYTPYNATNPNGYITGIISANVTTALGYTPVTNARTITINGTSYDLSADRSWTISATGTDNTKLPLAGGTMTGLLAFSNVTGNKVDFYHTTTGSGDRYGIQVQDSELRIHSGAAGAATGGITFGKSTTTTFTEALRIRNDGLIAVVNNLVVGSQQGYDNPGGWNKNILIDGTNHGRFRIKASNYTYGNIDVALWADSSVSPSHGINGSNAVFAFNGSITSLTVGGQTVIHTGNIGSQSVNYASSAGNASTLGGYGPNQSSGANTIVQRDGNGYIQNSYFYTSGGGSERNGSGISYIAGFNSSDYYIRSYTMQGLASAMSGATMNINGNSSTANSATTAGYIPTLYAGGVQANPQTYFNQSTGLKVAMTGSWSTWSDTLWINGYSGGDVLQMCALHTLRNGQPRMAISVQASNATSYGTYYEFITAYNIGSQSVSYATSAGSTGSLDGYSWFSYGKNIRGTDIYADSWFRNYNSLTGLYNQTNANHFYSSSGGAWAITGSGGNVELQFYSNHQTSLRGYVYGDTSSNFGLLNNQGGWSVRCYPGAGYGGALSGQWDVTGYVNAPTGFVSNSNPWGTSNSAFFPNGITTAGSTNWIYGHTYVGNAPANGNGHEFWGDGNSRHTGTITPNYIGRPSHSTGYFVGSYNNIGGNSAYTNPIYTIGSNYMPSDTSLGGMYGIGYSHPNFWGGGKTSGWGLYVCAGGAFNVTLGEGSTSIWAQNDIVAYSDIRVKDNIEVIPDAISKVQALRGVTFTRKDALKEDLGKRHAGVIAQEVLAVLPEVVSGTEKDMYSVAYGNMAGLFIEAFKEQQAQIESQGAQITELMQIIKTMKGL